LVSFGTYRNERHFEGGENKINILLEREGIIV